MEMKKLELLKKQKKVKSKSDNKRKSIKKLRGHILSDKQANGRKMEELQKQHRKLKRNRGTPPDPSKLGPMKACGEVLEKLFAQSSIGVFCEEVSKTRYPQYYKVIKRPMWLYKVEQRLYNGVYETSAEFEKDVHQIWANAIRYNPHGHPIHENAVKLEKFFILQMKSVPRILSTPDVETTVLEPLSSLQLERIGEFFPSLPEKRYDEALELFQQNGQLDGTGDQDEVELDLEVLPLSVQHRLYEMVDEQQQFGKVTIQLVESDSEDSDIILDDEIINPHDNGSTKPASPVKTENPFATMEIESNIQNTSNQMTIEQVSQTTICPEFPKVRVEEKVENPFALPEPSKIKKWSVPESCVKPEANKRSEYFSKLVKKPLPQNADVKPQTNSTLLSSTTTFRPANRPPILSSAPKPAEIVTKAAPIAASTSSEDAHTAEILSSSTIIPIINQNEQRDLLSVLDDLLF